MRKEHYTLCLSIDVKIIALFATKADSKKIFNESRFYASLQRYNRR